MAAWNGEDLEAHWLETPPLPRNHVPAATFKLCRHFMWTATQNACCYSRHCHLFMAPFGAWLHWRVSCAPAPVARRVEELEISSSKSRCWKDGEPTFAIQPCDSLHHFKSCRRTKDNQRPFGDFDRSDSNDYGS